MKKVILFCILGLFLLSCDSKDDIDFNKIDMGGGWFVLYKDCNVSGMHYKIFRTASGLYVVNVTKDSLEVQNLKK